jgi:rhodanese-related sulfurtransferase
MNVVGGLDAWMAHNLPVVSERNAQTACTG